MDPIRRGILEIADVVSTSVQNACQTFGFLPDGREMVTGAQSSAGLRVEFSDHSDEGWPGFSLLLPADAVFSHAMSGVLSRTAIWKVMRAVEEVIDHFPRDPEGPSPEFKHRGERTHRASLGERVDITLAGATAGWTGISVSQTRDPDSIASTLEARYPKPP